MGCLLLWDGLSAVWPYVIGSRFSRFVYPLLSAAIVKLRPHIIGSLVFRTELRRANTIASLAFLGRTALLAGCINYTIITSRVHQPLCNPWQQHSWPGNGISTNEEDM